MSAQTTLGAEMRDLARARILRGARVVLAQRGWSGTVDDVAEAAGVSRRTVFRYFATHAQLFQAAMAEIWELYGERLPPPCVRGDDVDAWLTQAAITLHALNADLVGRAFWDIYLHPQDDSAFMAVAADAIIGRHRLTDRLTQEVWRASGGKRRAPSWLTDAFALHLSAFATHGLAAGRPDRSPEDIGRVTAQLLSVLLRAALAQQPA